MLRSRERHWDVVVGIQGTRWRCSGRESGSGGGKMWLVLDRIWGQVLEFDRSDVGCRVKEESETAPRLPAQAAGRRQSPSAELGELCALDEGHVGRSRTEFS